MSATATTIPTASETKEEERSILRAFYRQQGVSEDCLTEAPAYRFVRLNPRFDRDETLRRLRCECQQHGKDESNSDVFPLRVSWLREEWGFYAVPGDLSLTHSACFQEGRVYGQDVSSGLAVAALLTDELDLMKVHHITEPSSSTPLWVLDLCCAPCLKLCAMADWLQAQGTLAEQQEPHVLVGVDVSEPRVQVGSRVLHKYLVDPILSNHALANARTPHVQILCQDGTTLASSGSQSGTLRFDSTVATRERQVAGDRRRLNKSAKARVVRQLRDVQQNSPWLATQEASRLYDRVLVDAECSTDGSVKHMRKRLYSEQYHHSHRDEGRLTILTDSEQLDALVDLQKRLAANGYRLLKPGGYMVYSTCSLSTKQNEHLVQWLLATFPDARLVPLSFAGSQGSLPGTVRILPGSLAGPTQAPSVDAAPMGTHDEAGARCLWSGGGGFFLAKITKVLVKDPNNC